MVGCVKEPLAESSAGTEELELMTSLPIRLVFMVLGLTFLGVGILGVITPGVPGFVFLLFALFFFSRSSDRMYRWMLTNKYFGQSLRDYKSGLGIPRRIKTVAVTSIVITVALSVTLFIGQAWWKAILIVLGIAGVWFVLTRPTREIELARRVR